MGFWCDYIPDHRIDRDSILLQKVRYLLALVIFYHADTIVIIYIILLNENLV